MEIFLIYSTTTSQTPDVDFCGSLKSFLQMAHHDTNTKGHLLAYLYDSGSI